MNNRVMVKVAATENCICFRTVSRNQKSPRRFYITRDEFAKLETQASVTTHDGWSFAVLRRDARTDTLEVQFTWLSGSNYALTGWEETVTLPYTRLAAFVEDSAQEGGPRTWKALSIDCPGKQHRSITYVDTASEALVVSIGERAGVDLPFMSQLAGKPEAEIIIELQGAIYRDPVRGVWQTADEYLSGDVRRKLREAQATAERDPAYQGNVDALAGAQPRDLDAAEIEMRLGTTCSGRG